MKTADTYIIFELAGFAYGVRSDHVQHVDLLEHVTPVPNAAPALDGVVFSRGQVIPALNLRARFGLSRQPPDSSTRLIFLKVQQRLVALIVDSAREFRSIPADTIKPIGETLHGIQGNFLTGMATVRDRLVLLLDVGAVLSLEESSLPAGAPSSIPVQN